jgi:two-component system, OmpR family, phosphate regulon sensor histidine kinase PhoR
MTNLPPPDTELPEPESITDLWRELRAPLTTIKTALSLLDSTSLKPPQRKKYQDLIRSECNRQNALIDGAEKLWEVEQQPWIDCQTNAADLLPAVVGTYQPLASDLGITLSCQVPANLPLVGCSEVWLKQITMNLLDNSIKFTRPGGAVSLQAMVQNDYVQLEFRDNGVGIASADLPKIFDRFYRGRNLPPTSKVIGAGLGLTIIQKILLRCGGSISVVSQPDTGSRFRVLLGVK